MSRIEIFRVRGGKFQAYEKQYYFGQDDYEGWVNSLKHQAELANKTTVNSTYAWHVLNVMQNIVEGVEVMQAKGLASWTREVVEYHKQPSAVVCMGPDAETLSRMARRLTGQHEGKVVESSTGDVYRVGRYVPVTGPKTAYYELTDVYDGWESHIKAETLDGHLAAENWKERS